MLVSGNPVRKIAKRPDTIVVCGVQSRWFAETRVSSKPSTLVMHTIFSALGKIRWVLVFRICLAHNPVPAFSMGYSLNELVV